jgi:hypothetical protein
MERLHIFFYDNAEKPCSGFLVESKSLYSLPNEKLKLLFSELDDGNLDILNDIFPGACLNYDQFMAPFVTTSFDSSIEVSKTISRSTFHGLEATVGEIEVLCGGVRLDHGEISSVSFFSSITLHMVEPLRKCYYEVELVEFDPSRYMHFNLLFRLGMQF